MIYRSSEKACISQREAEVTDAKQERNTSHAAFPVRVITGAMNEFAF
jgi:hypothetical protein